MVYFNKDHSGIGMQTWSVSDMTTAGSWFNYGTGPESSILGTKSGSRGVKPLILNDYLYSPHTLKFCCKTCVEKQFFIYLLPTVGQELDPYQKHTVIEPSSKSNKNNNESIIVIIFIITRQILSI